MKLMLSILCLALPFGLMAQVTVQTQPLDDVLVDLERRAPAAVQPLNNSLMAAEVSAVVSTVYAEVGQQVARGDTLLELDAADYSLALQLAEANLASARAQKAQADSKLERARQLLEDQYISPDTLLDRETDVTVWAAQIQTAEVAVSQALRNLGKCIVLAPFDGVVTERLAQVGGFVTNGSPLLRLVQVDQIELDAELPASVADSLVAADSLWFESQNQRWGVELLRMSPVIEAERRSRRARFGFVGDAPAVGRSGEVVWRVERGMLPSGLISRRNGELGVFVADNGLARFISLPGAQEGRPVAVDLPADTTVVTLGRERLQDGDTLSVTR